MALSEPDFPSANGRDTIHAWIYTPVREPRAIVQLIHGLGEHSRRYLRLITALLDADFVVAAEDHAGHGATAMASGVWADAGEDAGRVMVADARSLGATVREQHPGLPFVVFGHSMGSMIARGAAVESAAEIDGLVLCGIAAQIPGAHTVDRAALAAVPDQAGPAPLAYVGALFDGFVSRFGEGAGPTDWVARDADVVRDHGKDPFNNFGAPMSARFLRGFLDLYDAANGDGFYAALPSTTPVLILAGDQDPVTNYGEGAYHVANRLVATGHPDVRTRVYPGLRHEVHNEPESRDDVAAELIGFVERVLTGPR
ncbi:MULTISPECIES: alpha/beta fold hydrolase [Tsukamurella]|uniref:Lysophospholipase n=2 Tax=Tsukamurella TaxID=2060 RepID=A0A5C5S3F8_9ACTN|nr:MULTISPECIES: alpha/beta fold hydrolase [Tsukamurella]NMD56084.1 alpha/beta hydrolase [Tsukamurella columbiensis]TWS28811.1 lysophospholipase [Tsukamurella conjunctivitidis]